MGYIYVIITHHEEPVEVAEDWRRAGVCAIGYNYDGNIQKRRKDELGAAERTFLEINKGDVILAYAKRNMIAYVGNVIDERKHYSTRNKIGYYPNQIRVNWWAEPHHFSRWDLPKALAKQLGIHGKAVTKLNLDGYGFDETIRLIRDARSGSLLTRPNEDIIKIGLHNLILDHSDWLEKGLTIERAEVQITPGERPDFIGKDKTGRTVLIECKGTATESAYKQIIRYSAAYRKRKPRLFLVAFRFDTDCQKLAKKAGIKTIKCELKFKRA